MDVRGGGGPDLEAGFLYVVPTKVVRRAAAAEGGKGEGVRTSGWDLE
jgi:hypothetical protein